MFDMAHETTPSLTRFLSARELRNLTGLSDPTLWRMRQRGELPEPVRLSPGRVGWRVDDIEHWIASRGTRG
jgi:prophage regulatory protein